MRLETLELTFFVEFRVMVKAELYGSADDFLRSDEPVGFGHDFAVNATWFMPRRGTMVFDSLYHDLNLVFVKPFVQILIFSDDAPRDEVVGVAAFTKPGIVVCGNGIDHILIYIIMPGQGHAPLNDLFSMVTLMCRVEMVVAR